MKFRNWYLIEESTEKIPAVFEQMAKFFGSFFDRLQIGSRWSHLRHIKEPQLQRAGYQAKYFLSNMQQNGFLIKVFPAQKADAIEPVIYEGLDFIWFCYYLQYSTWSKQLIGEGTGASDLVTAEILACIWRFMNGWDNNNNDDDGDDEPNEPSPAPFELVGA